MRSLLGLVGMARSVSSLSAPVGGPGLITFDCTGTLFEPRQQVGVLYKKALLDASDAMDCREAAAALDEQRIGEAFGAAYAAADGRRPCFGAGACTSEEWWLGVVGETFAAAGLAGREADELVSRTFRSLYDGVFCGAAGWRLMPHAKPALERISRWRAAQPAAERTRIAVVSNWDERLSQVHAYYVSLVRNEFATRQ